MGGCANKNQSWGGNHDSCPSKTTLAGVHGSTDGSIGWRALAKWIRCLLRGWLQCNHKRHVIVGVLWYNITVQWVQKRLLLLCDVVPRTTLNVMLYQWMHQLLYLSFYKYIIKVCTLKNWWWGGIIQCRNIYKKCTPLHPLKTTYRIHGIPCYMCHHGHNYPPKYWNWSNFSSRMTSACLYPQVHDFLIRC